MASGQSPRGRSATDPDRDRCVRSRRPAAGSSRCTRRGSRPAGRSEPRRHRRPARRQARHRGRTAPGPPRRPVRRGARRRRAVDRHRCPAVARRRLRRVVARRRQSLAARLPRRLAPARWRRWALVLARWRRWVGVAALHRPAAARPREPGAARPRAREGAARRGRRWRRRLGRGGLRWWFVARRLGGRCTAPKGPSDGACHRPPDGTRQHRPDRGGSGVGRHRPGLLGHHERTEPDQGATDRPEGSASPAGQGPAQGHDDRDRADHRHPGPDGTRNGQ